ncbi:MAG: type I methionyl aminopeptidase [Proteobacteria bacterium]|nr:type I methionyl aminopeptidase [Pseudomonadota bacterium]MBU4053440.1 type I methionyl aminopeptidase [Pseudomonadota bacterium]
MKIKMQKIGRNEPCPCGSGKKFKKCCFDKGDDLFTDYEVLYKNKFNIHLKTDLEIEQIRQSGKIAVELLNLAETILKPGMKTDEINGILHEYTLDKGAVPAPLNYKGFPKSVCISVNEEICHGIPGNRIIKEGDIVNIDVTPILKGYYADANKTYFVGEPDAKARKIVSVAKTCLFKGMDAVKPGNTLGDIGFAIQQHAESQKCSVVREFVGHGIGVSFHEPPQVPHYGKKGQGLMLVPRMVFTIEPMINLGERFLHVLEDRWTAVTNDGSLSAQFEQTILVTDEGCESLTPFS